MSRQVRSRFFAVLLTASLATTWLTVGTITAGAASPSASAGVSASTITVGIPYIDFTSLKSIGVNLDDGDFPDAYKALIANLNATGGIAGRKIVPVFLAVNPTGTTAAVTACTQLVQDDKVFVAIGPEQSDCYLETYHVPTIQGLFEGTPTPGAAANFTILPPANAYDPLQLKIFAQKGAFKGKKVGLFAGAATDQDELKVVQGVLKKLHVDVVQTGVDSAPATDQVAENQQASAIAQHFQSSGVNEVVAVGTGSAIWPRALQEQQSTYHPSWIATDGQALQGSNFGSGSGLSATYLKNVLSSSPIPSYPQIWKDPAIQKCKSVISKAYPSDVIKAPTLNSSTSDATFLAVIEACQNMAIFSKIAAAAGRHLTVSSFTNAGFGLRGVSLPGTGGPVSFGTDQPYALGPVYLMTYDPKTGQIVTAPTSSTS